VPPPIKPPPPAKRPLTADQRVVLKAIVAAARAGARAPTADDLLALLPHRESVSTTVNIIQALEARGMIKVERYQRSRRIILPSGKATAMPTNTTPHWRDRPRNIPSPARAAIERRPEPAEAIMAEARKAGRAPQDFLADLVWIGWQAYQGR
jgi:hypothetical protein